MLDMAFNEINPYREKRLVGAAYQMTDDSVDMSFFNQSSRSPHDILNDSSEKTLPRTERLHTDPGANEANAAFNEINQQRQAL